jgi:elongation factor 2
LGFLSEAQLGNRFMNVRPDEKEKGSTLRANVCSLFESAYDEKQPYLFNVVDTPGHVEFSPETQGAIRLADGAVVVVDANEGVTVATDNFITWCLKERVKPVLFVNKVDKCIIDMQKDVADLYNDIRQAVEAVNVTITTLCGDKPFCPNLEVKPEKGDVIIGSALYGWAFGLADFAKVYAAKFSIEQDKMTERLWGENYFNAKTKKFSKNGTAADGGQLPSCFEQFVLTPIKQMTDSIIGGTDKYQKMCTALKIELKPADLKLEGKALYGCVSRKWMDGGNALCKLMVSLPDPKTAQSYRAEVIWTGPDKNDDVGKAIKECNRKLFR